MSSISKFLILVPPIIAEKVFVPPVILIVPSPAAAGVTTALTVILLSPAKIIIASPVLSFKFSPDEAVI